MIKIDEHMINCHSNIKYLSFLCVPGTSGRTWTATVSPRSSTAWPPTSATTPTRSRCTPTSCTSRGTRTRTPSSRPTAGCRSPTWSWRPAPDAGGRAPWTQPLPNWVVSDSCSCCWLSSSRRRTRVGPCLWGWVERGIILGSMSITQLYIGSTHINDKKIIDRKNNWAHIINHFTFFF